MASDARASRTSPPPTNVAWVADRLREDIVEGRLRGGERIKEAPLSRQLGVSRGPIRDALRLLHAEGLVALQPNRGAMVPEVRLSDVIEVQLIRERLGSLALRRLMLPDRRPAVPRLDDALRRVERAAERSMALRASAADLSYQDAIVGAAALPRLTREFERLTWQTRMFIAVLELRDAVELPVMLAEIRSLHAALTAQDAELTAGLWARKFERWTRAVLERAAPGSDDAAVWIALST